MIAYSRVKFLGKNGTDEDLKEAKKVLTVGKEYRVYQIIIGDWHTVVDLPQGRFNSVMFEGVEGHTI